MAINGGVAHYLGGVATQPMGRDYTARGGRGRQQGAWLHAPAPVSHSNAGGEARWASAAFQNNPAARAAPCVRASPRRVPARQRVYVGPRPLAARRVAHLRGRRRRGATEGIDRREVLGLGRGRRAAAGARVVVTGETLEHGPGGAGAAAPPRQGCGVRPPASRCPRERPPPLLLRCLAAGGRWWRPRRGSLGAGVRRAAPLRAPVRPSPVAGRRCKAPVRCRKLRFAAASAGISVPGSGGSLKAPVRQDKIPMRPSQPLRAPAYPSHAPVLRYKAAVHRCKPRCARPGLWSSGTRSRCASTDPGASVPRSRFSGTKPRFAAISPGTSVPRFRFRRPSPARSL